MRHYRVAEAFGPIPLPPASMRRKVTVIAIDGHDRAAIRVIRKPPWQILGMPGP
jgi:hypothetical protein